MFVRRILVALGLVAAGLAIGPTVSHERAAALAPTEFTPGAVGTLSAVAGASSVDGALASATVVGGVDLSSDGTNTVIVQPSAVRQLAAGTVSTLQTSVSGACAVSSSQLGTFSSAVTAGSLGTIVASSCGLFKIAPGPTAFGPVLPTGVAQHVASDGLTVAAAVFNSTTNTTTLLVLASGAWTTAATLTGPVVDLALSTDSVWAASASMITRVIRSTNTVSTFATMSDLGAVTSLAVGSNAVWVGSGNRIVRIDIASSVRALVAGVVESGLIDGVGVVGRLTGPKAMGWAGGRLMFLNSGDRLRVVDPAFAPTRAPDIAFDKTISTDSATVSTIATGAMGGVAAAGGSVAFTSVNGLELLNTTTLARTVLATKASLCATGAATVATDGESFFVTTSCGIKRVNAVSGQVSTLATVSTSSLVFNDDGFLYAASNGIVRIDVNLGLVTQVTSGPAQPASVVVSDHEQLWTVSGGIDRYSKAAGTSTRVTGPTYYGTSPNSSSNLGDYRGYGTLTRAGNALFAIRGTGLARFDTDRSTVVGITGVVANGPFATPTTTAFGGDITFVSPNAVASDGLDLWVTDLSGLHRIRAGLPPTMSVPPQYGVDLGLAAVSARTVLVSPVGGVSQTWSDGIFMGGKLYMRDSIYNGSAYDQVFTVDTTIGATAVAINAGVDTGSAGINSLTSDGRSIYYTRYQNSTIAGGFRSIEKYSPPQPGLTSVSAFLGYSGGYASAVWASPNRLIAAVTYPLAAGSWELWSVDAMTGDHVTLYVPLAGESTPKFKSDGTSLWWAAGSAVKRMALTGGPIDTYPVSIPTLAGTSTGQSFYNGNITAIELTGNTILLGVSGNYGVYPTTYKTGYILGFDKATHATRQIAGHHNLGGAADGTDPTFSFIGGLTTNGSELFIGDGNRIRALTVVPFATAAQQGAPKGATMIADPVNSATGVFTHDESDLVAPGAVAGLGVGRWYNSSDMRSSVHGQGWVAGSSDTLLPDAAGGGYTYAESTGRVTSFALTTVPAESFETSAGAWGPLAGTVAPSTLEAHSGTKSLQVTTGGTKANVAFTPGVSNTFATWVKGPGTILPAIEFFDAALVSLGTAQVPSLQLETTAWQYWTGSFTPPAGTVSVQVRINNNDVNPWYLDDVTVGAGPPNTQYADGFEGTRSVWVGADVATATAQARTGTKSFQVSSGTGAKGFVPFTPGVANTLTGWMKGTGTVTPTIQYYGSDWSNLGTSPASILVLSGTAWQQWTATYTPPVGTGYAQIRLANADVNPWFFDDVSVVATASWTHPIGVDATLVTRSDGSPALLFTSGEVAEFDLAGRLEQRAFPDGQTVTAVRAASGLVSSVTSSAGPSLTYTYASPATGTRLMSVAGSWGDTVSYGYDTAGRMVSVTRPGGVTSTYTNDPVSGLLTAITDPSGVREVLNVYNTSRQVISQTAASGAVTTFTYDGVARSTKVHDPVTNTDLTYTHDLLGRVVSITDPYGKIVTRSWDAQSNPTSAVNRNGTSLANTFDASNNLLTATDPKTGVTAYTYDSLNRVKSVKDPAGNISLYSYVGTDRLPTTATDPQGHVGSNVITNGLIMSSTDPDLVTTTYTYTGRQVASVTDGLGNTTSYLYDTLGRRTKTTLPSGKFSTTAYDTASRVTSQTAFDGGVTVYTYDLTGRPLTVTDPTNAVTSNTYDTAGRLATSTAANGAVSTYTYDGDNQLVSTLLPGGPTTSQTYGPLGRVLTQTDELGRVTTYTYDVAGNQATVTAPDGGVSTTTYDAQGRVATQTDPANRVSSTTFDTFGRVATQTQPGALTTLYTYDTLGRQLTATDPRGGVTTTAYTPGGRVASVQNPAGLVTGYTYDLAGRLKTQVDPPNLTTTIGYDIDGNKTSVTDPAGLITALTYDAGRRVATVTDPAGVVTTNTWSLRSELLTTKTGTQGTIGYTYNPDRTLKNTTDANGNVTSFGYDARGRRTSRTGPLGGIDAWTYDLAGQQLTATDAASRQMVYTYDNVGRLATVTDPTGRKTTTAYNTDGTVKTVAVLNGTTYSYTYNPAGQVSAVTDTSGASWFYGYEPGGQINSYMTPTGRETTWSYDNSGRRTKLAYPDGSTYVYGYDTAGRVATITPGETLADTFTGAVNAAPDTAKWAVTSTSGGTAKIVGNELQLAYTATAGSAVAAAAVGLVQGDVEIRAKYRFPTTAAASAGLLRIVGRQVTGTTPTNYRVEINSSTATAIIYRTVGTTTTSLGTFTVPVTTAAQQIRFQVKGSTISARVWLDGTSEPVAWTKQVTDSQVTLAGTARVEVRQNGTVASQVYVDNVSITNPTTAPAAVAAYAYNADSQVTGETLTGGTRSRTFTNGRLATFNETLPGLSRATTMAYDTSGRIVSEATGGVTTAYGYDPAGQLLSVMPTSGNATVYTYDQLGRRATTKIGAAAATANTYDPTGALLTAGGGTSSYTYDTAGRRLTETSTGNSLTYTYNAAGQLASLARVAGATTTTQTRTYDPAGTLAQVANVTGSTTTLDWDPTGGVAQLLGMTAAGTIDIVQGVTGLAGSKVGVTSAAYGIDQYGSAITGAQARSTSYTAFGDPTTPSTFEPRLGYRGELTLDSLTYLRARDYQPSTGAFTSADPVEGRHGATSLNNRYHYVDNDPLRRIDPQGLRSTDSDVDQSRVSPIPSQTALALIRAMAARAGARCVSGAGLFWSCGAAGGAALGGAIIWANPGGYVENLEGYFEDRGWGGFVPKIPNPFAGIAGFFSGAGQTGYTPTPTPAPVPQPAAAGSRGGPPTTTAGRCATNNGGREYSERELKEAENELRRNKDFRNWFHRNYKADVVRSVGDRSNPDLDREQVRDAFEEWIECGKPRSK
jgi:RHS repeat-associated protein